MSNGSLDFDFDMAGVDRAELLAKTSQTIQALDAELGADAASMQASATDLFDHLNKGVARFSAFPDVIRLEEEHFTKHGLPVPLRFQELNRQNQFFWLRFPITLFAPEDMPFNKLECAVEFNPGVADGYLRPRAQMILPDRKFKQYFEANTGFELRINENFEFESGSPKLDLSAGDAHVKGQAAADAKAAGKLGFVAGPFTYRLKKATVDHSPVGTEKVLWRLTGAEFFQEDDPTLIVVLQVPRAVKDVKIAAALQAYHQFNPWTSALGKAFRYLTKRDADFFSKGAPLRDPATWDITPAILA